MHLGENLRRVGLRITKGVDRLGLAAPDGIRPKERFEFGECLFAVRGPQTIERMPYGIDVL
ncbi:hypothetical protein EG835_10685 [bacterium]|nr:hypothetical protein [bacterium]